jgi:hypothetical protein
MMMMVRMAMMEVIAVIQEKLLIHQVEKNSVWFDSYICLLLELLEEKRAILDFLQDEEDASQFLDRSRRLFSDQKSHMKEAKKQ